MKRIKSNAEPPLNSGYNGYQWPKVIRAPRVVIRPYVPDVMGTDR